MDQEIEALLESEKQYLQKLKDIVAKTVDDEKLMIDNLMHPPEEILTAGQKISDKVARFGGSWAFIISFFVVMILWILFNTLSPRKDEFDPYPFILMNLVLSCIAALQAPIIMMSQNRKDQKDRQRSENDYLVNLKAELELRSLHKKVDVLLEEQLRVLTDTQAKQLELLKSIQRAVAPGNA